MCGSCSAPDGRTACQLHPGERASEGLRRILAAQLGAAEKCVAEDGRLTDEDIHSARKWIRRARTTLRLMRPGLNHALFVDCNQRLRDAARALMHVRDAKVQLDSLGALRRRNRALADGACTRRLNRHLKSQLSLARHDLVATSGSLLHVRSALRAVKAQSQRWRIEADGWLLLGPALGRIYRRGRRAYLHASKQRADEALHEWRKQVKYLWYSLQVLAPQLPRLFDEMSPQLRKLNGDLGEDHDLAVLHRTASHTTTLDEDVEALDRLLRKRRRLLQRRAFAMGERIYAAKPGRFGRRIEAAWRRQAKACVVRAASGRPVIVTTPPF